MRQLVVRCGGIDSVNCMDGWLQTCGRLTSIMQHNYVMINGEGKVVRSKDAMKYQVISKSKLV